MLFRSEESKRAKPDFKTRSDISALQTLEVREADDFESKFPVISAFRKELVATKLIKFDPAAFLESLSSFSVSTLDRKKLGPTISHFDPFFLLQEIKADTERWNRFKYWLKELVGIEDVILDRLALPKGDSSSATAPAEIGKFIGIVQNRTFWMPEQLSTGTILIFGLLTTMFGLVETGGAILFEEPEVYLHPKAIIELMRFFRDFNENQTIIFSTHSPVVLNAMRPEEVSVLKPSHPPLVTATRISDITQAIAALNRNFISFGDLLQRDFDFEQEPVQAER